MTGSDHQSIPVSAACLGCKPLLLGCEPFPTGEAGDGPFPSVGTNVPNQIITGPPRSVLSSQTISSSAGPHHSSIFHITFHLETPGIEPMTSYQALSTVEPFRSRLTNWDNEGYLCIVQHPENWDCQGRRAMEEPVQWHESVLHLGPPCSQPHVLLQKPHLRQLSFHAWLLCHSVTLRSCWPVVDGVISSWRTARRLHRQQQLQIWPRRLLSGLSQEGP